MAMSTQGTLLGKLGGFFGRSRTVGWVVENNRKKVLLLTTASKSIKLPLILGKQTSPLNPVRVLGGWLLVALQDENWITSSLA